MRSTTTWRRSTASTTSHEDAVRVTGVVTGSLILALDQGTTSSRAMLVDVARADPRDGLRGAAPDLPVADTGGVYLVPAFVGLGAPYWDAYARGTLVGITRGTGLPEISRAAIDAMAYQVADVVEAMRSDADVAIDILRVDGGAARNDRLCQFQADLLGVPVERPVHLETTAIGAAALAGLAVGVWDSPAAFAATRAVDRRFEPAMEPEERVRKLRGWHRAVERSRGWVEPGE